METTAPKKALNVCPINKLRIQSKEIASCAPCPSRFAIGMNYLSSHTQKVGRCAGAVGRFEEFEFSPEFAFRYTSLKRMPWSRPVFEGLGQGLCLKALVKACV
jgi:hypothetical protein